MMKQIIIVGGGPSISEGVEKDLWDKILNSWTIGCNSIFKFFTPTALTFVDHHQFYNLFYKELESVPLIIGRLAESLKTRKHTNTILLKEYNSFDRTLQLGCLLVCYVDFGQ
jgi:hypothetical protein